MDRGFLDWPFLPDDAAAVYDRATAFATETAPGLFDPRDERREAVADACRALVAAMGRAGLLGVATALAAPLSARRLCLSREALARQHALVDFAFAMQGLGSGPIGLFGSDEQKAAHLPGVAAGGAIAAFALSEREAGSDVAALATTARKDGADYVLDGQKTWISNAGIAGLYVVFARTGEGNKGLSAFVVEAGTRGLTATYSIDVTAPHPLGVVVLENCRVPARAMIGAPGDGFRIALGTLDVFRATVGAAALGFARRALEETIAHVSERRLFGARLADMQLTQGAIAERATATDAAALLVYRAAWRKDSGHRVTRESAMAKLFATEEAQKTVDLAVQLFGGLGVVRGTVAERLYRDVRALRIYEGASEIQKLVIARSLLAA
ncbi:Butyryl-CoA dehydrogenase [Rhodovulum sp. PH10]|nr:Butyryl-CoA dehydrogenase [Rhodovulum sp. PH10]